MQVRLATPADEAAITRYIGLHARAMPFHGLEWLRAVERGCGQRAHVLIASDPGHLSGDIVGALPLTEVRSPLFGPALVSSGFAVGGGILCDTPDAGEALAAEALALAHRLSCPSVELRGGYLPEGWVRDDTTYLGFARDLAADDEAELLAIPRKQRAEVRRALAFELTTDVGTARDDRDAHYHVYATSVRNLGTPVFPRALFDAVLDECEGDADILTVRRDGEPLASVLSLYHRGTVMPYWGGGTADARTWRANDLMYFALMRHARGRGCNRFDFGRSKVGTGAAAFKRNWGFEGAPLVYASMTLDGAVQRTVNPLDPKYSRQVKLWSKLPLAVANRIGPLIARGLG